MKTKIHGWILQDMCGEFVDIENKIVNNLKCAFVFKTRAAARSKDGSGITNRVGYVVSKSNTNIIRKVEINKNGEAVKLIPGR